MNKNTVIALTLLMNKESHEKQAVDWDKLMNKARENMGAFTDKLKEIHKDKPELTQAAAGSGIGLALYMLTTPKGEKSLMGSAGSAGIGGTIGYLLGKAPDAVQSRVVDRYREAVEGAVGNKKKLEELKEWIEEKNPNILGDPTIEKIFQEHDLLPDTFLGHVGAGFSGSNSSSGKGGEAGNAIKENLKEFFRESPTWLNAFVGGVGASGGIWGGSKILKSVGEAYNTMKPLAGDVGSVAGRAGSGASKIRTIAGARAALQGMGKTTAGKVAVPLALAMQGAGMVRGAIDPDSVGEAFLRGKEEGGHGKWGRIWRTAISPHQQGKNIGAGAGLNTRTALSVLKQMGQKWDIHGAKQRVQNRTEELVDIAREHIRKGELDKARQIYEPRKHLATWKDVSLPELD